MQRMKEEQTEKMRGIEMQTMAPQHHQTSNTFWEYLHEMDAWIM